MQLRGERRAGWGKGWVRTKKGVALGMVASWRVKLSEESGVVAVFIGVVSQYKKDWDDTGISNRYDSAWFAYFNSVWANGFKQSQGYQSIFKQGDTVHLTLDRSVHTLTIVGSYRTVVIPNLPMDVILYPAMCILSNISHVELFDFDCKPAHHEVKKMSSFVNEEITLEFPRIRSKKLTI